MEFSEEYSKDMKLMKLLSIIAIIAVFLMGTIFLCCTIVWYLYFTEGSKDVANHKLVFVILELISGISIIGLVRLDYRANKRKKEFGYPYILGLNDKISYETLCNTLKKHTFLFNCFNLDDSSVYKIATNNDIFKYYVFKMDEYNKVEYKKTFKNLNEKYEKKYNEKHFFRDYKRRARLIFIFVDRWSKETDQLVHYFQKDLQRVQTSMTYIIYNHKIYLSPIYCDFVNDGAYRFINKEAKKILDMVK